MEKNTFLLMNNIILQIYEVEDFTEMKQSFLNLISLLIPNSLGSILMANTDYNPCNPKMNLLKDPICVPEALTELELKYLELEDDDLTRWMAMSKQSMIIRENDLISEEKRIQTTIYKLCYAPYGMHYSLQLFLVYKETFLGVVTLYRTKAEGDFSDSEIFLLKAFSEHLSLRFYRELSKEKLPKCCINKMALSSEYHLTQREIEVLDLIFQELSNEKIANTLCISNSTLKKHIQNLYNKLEVSSRWDLLRFREK